MDDYERVKGPFDEALAAVERHETQQAIAQINKLRDEALKVHDRLVLYVNLLLSFISEEIGEEKVREAWQYVIERVHEKGLSRLKGRPHKEVVKSLVAEHMAHGSDFTLEEEEGKTTIVLHCCGSGGRLRRALAPVSEGHLKEKRSWGFGREGISYYCSHCSIVSEDSPNWDVGFKINVVYGEQFDQRGDPKDDPCRFEIIQED